MSWLFVLLHGESGDCCGREEQRTRYEDGNKGDKKGGSETDANEIHCRTLVYVEGDATLGSYTDAEGKPRTALNIVQSKLLSFPSEDLL